MSHSNKFEMQPLLLSVKSGKTMIAVVTSGLELLNTTIGQPIAKLEELDI